MLNTRKIQYAPVSAAYSAIVRSLENLPELATFKIALLITSVDVANAVGSGSQSLQLGDC
jgi:hypothetical protein